MYTTVLALIANSKAPGGAAGAAIAQAVRVFNDAQARGVARMASAPHELPGAVAGRNSSGMASVTLAAGGKVMTRERCTAVVRGVVALHSSVTLGRASEGGVRQKLSPPRRL
jgi:hypothetical protein